VPFRRLLDQLVAGVGAARGAVFCDREGEHVVLSIRSPPPAGCGALSEYDLKLCGAQVAASLLLLATLNERERAGDTAQVRVLCEHGALLCRLLPGRYYLTLLLAPGGRWGRAAWLLEETARAVTAEL
jgi:hypothetical protein